MNTDGRIGTRLVRQAVANPSGGLQVDKAAPVGHGSSDRQPRLPVMITDTRRSIAGVAAFPGIGIAPVEADRRLRVAPDLPGHADLQRPATVVVDEGVFALLPIPLDLQGQPIGQSVFGEHAEGTLPALGRQVGKPAVCVKATTGDHVLIFEDDLALALRLGPGAGPRGTGRKCCGETGQPRRSDSQMS